jgi:hypothetical protein
VYDFQKHFEAAHRELLMAQKLLNAEIAAYPSPISGCDAQFNHLLGERQKICQALGTLTEEVFVPTSRQPMQPYELSRS